MDSSIFWMIYGTSKMFTKSGSVLFLLGRNASTNIKNMDTSLKRIHAYLTILEIPKFQNVRHYQTSQLWNSILVCCCQNLVGPKQLASPSVFNELYDGGHLKIWKSEHL